MVGCSTLNSANKLSVWNVSILCLKEIAAILMFEERNECEIYVFDYREATLIRKCRL